jgi:hypothetical protein
MEVQYVVQVASLGVVGLLIGLVGYLMKATLDSIKADLKTLVLTNSSQSGDIRVIQEQISQIKGDIRAQDERSRANHEETMLGRNRYHELAGKFQAILAEMRLLRGVLRPAPPLDESEVLK